MLTPFIPLLAESQGFEKMQAQHQGKSEMELSWVTVVSDICKAIPPAVYLTFPGHLPSLPWCSMLREVTGASELPHVAIHGALPFTTAFWPVLLPGIHTPRWSCSEVLSAQKVHCQKAQSTHHIPCGAHRMFLRHIETQESPLLQFVSIKMYIPFFFFFNSTFQHCAAERGIEQWCKRYWFQASFFNCYCVTMDKGCTFFLLILCLAKSQRG